MRDLIIIGAGPAGVSAGIYASRQKLDLLMISKEIGGQVAKKAVDIENYLGFGKISGPELAKIFHEQIKSNEIEVILDEVLKIEKQGEKFIVSMAKGKIHESLAVIICSGADPRPLEVEGEKEFIGKGVSYCALCDGPVFSNKTVAVIGGGNSGFESAMFLSNYVKKIHILEYGEKLKADKENQELVYKTKKAEIILNAKILKIEGGSFVKSLSYQDLKSEQKKILPVDGIFVEIGYSPATAFAKGLVDFSDRDEIITERETYETKTPGLFAAGDCNSGKYKQIVTAAGEGAKAALAAYEYLQKSR
ncbi:MAG: FAD-dependent oxidoreductase [Candidatus Staskawiczbacteria bacterium]|nr:FAD-dependent oxidoreductase [Candidatus Staskawiczbacteria bacterium]